MKRAFITGITGQDGSYLAEFLLSKGYEVHGLMRRASSFNTRRIEHLYPDLLRTGENFPIILHYGDISVTENLQNIILDIQPDEVYHLAAQSHVRVSFDIPEYTANVTGLGTLRILEVIRQNRIKAKFYQASSSEIFGNAKPPQNEETPYQPRSPYAVSKAFACWMVRNYREGYGINASNGILFNHESPRRGVNFVTRKITHGLAAILAGKQSSIFLGNLDSRRDWGYAPEYVEAMWLMLQQDQPGDYVIGTGETHSIREFLSEAFNYVGLDWQSYVKIDARYLRPTEVDVLLADSGRARRDLNWQPRVKFHELVRIMMDADLELHGLQSPGEGRRILEERFGGWHRWDQQVISMEH